MGPRWQYLLRSIIGICFTGWTQLAGSVGFEVSGTITFSQPEHRETPHSQVRFSIKVQDELWFLRLEPKTAEPFDLIEAAYDGVQVYCVTMLETAAKKEIHKHPELLGKLPLANAWIYNGHILHIPHVHWAGPIWLAYGSGTYLKSRTNNMIEPVTTLSVGGVEYDPLARFLQKAEWELATVAPFLPTKVIYYADGVIRVRGVEAGRFPPPFDNGFTNAIYEVIAFTNISGLAFPRVAVLTVFSPKITGVPQRNLRVINQYTIELSQAGLSTYGATFVPQLPDKCVVTDGRLQDEVGTLTYFSEGFWPTVNQLKKTAVYMQARLDRGPQFGTLADTRPRRIVVIAAMILMVIISFVALWHVARKQTRLTRLSRYEKTD